MVEEVAVRVLGDRVLWFPGRQAEPTGLVPRDSHRLGARSFSHLWGLRGRRFSLIVHRSHVS